MPNQFSNLITSRLYKPLVCLVAATTLMACSSDEEESGEGYLQVYNLLHNASTLEVNINIDDEDKTIANLDAFDAHAQILLDNDDYGIELSIPVSTDNIQDIHQSNYQVNPDQVTFVIATGDVTAPEFVSFHYDFIDPDTEDGEFAFHFVNTSSTHQDLEVYISNDDANFTDATLLGSAGFMSLSHPQLFETGGYKFYVTKQGTDEIVFESDDIDFDYTNQQMLVIRDAIQPSVSPLTLDVVSTSGSVKNHKHIEQIATVRFYNSIAKHELMPLYDNQLDISLAVQGETTQYLIDQGDKSETIQLEFGDYAVSLDNENGEELARDQILSVDGGSNDTVFYYLTEVETEVDEDEETETEVYVSYLQTSANDNQSIHSHNVQVLNFIAEYPNLVVYFVGTGESISTTNNKISASRSYSANIELFNDQYDVFVMVNETGNEFLVTSTSLPLDESSTNNYLIIEQTDNGQYQINVMPQ